MLLWENNFRVVGVTPLRRPITQKQRWRLIDSEFMKWRKELPERNVTFDLMRLTFSRPHRQEETGDSEMAFDVLCALLLIFSFPRRVYSPSRASSVFV